MTAPQIFKAISQSEKFQFGPIFHGKTKLIFLFAAWLACISPDSASIQRMYMEQNSQQARETYLISTVFSVAIRLTVVFVSIVVCVGYSNLTDSNIIWPVIINDSSTVFKGFFVISLFTMSTADSHLNIASSGRL